MLDTDVEFIPAASKCNCLHEQHTAFAVLWLLGSCDNAGLATRSALCVLCLCDERVYCETWEVMSQAVRHFGLEWQAEIVQLYDGCLHFLCSNGGGGGGGGPFVNTSAGKGWVEVCIDGVGAGNRNLF